MSKQIAVVILNWNGSAMMKRFLPSVITNSPEADVIIADNGSTDDSLEMLQREFPTVGIIQLDKNYGFAEGYNKALEKIDHPYSLLLNSDVEVTPNWLFPLLQYMESHPKTAACQPKLKAEGQRDMFEYAGASGGYLDCLGYPFCRGRILGTIEKDEGQYNTIVPVLWASGAALMVRTSIYKQVGGLDGRFFAHMEEIDLCWRMRSRNMQIVCIPESEVYHVGGGTLNKSNPRKTFLNFRNNLLMIYKNTREERLQKVLRWRCILDHVAMLQMALTGHWKDAQAVCKARKEFQQIKPDFEKSRQENMAAASSTDIPEIMNYSLLWQYYVKGKHTFQSLQKENII